MKIDRRTISTVFLVLGMVSLLIGIGTDRIAFSWAAIVFILISLVAGGKWMRPRKK